MTFLMQATQAADVSGWPDALIGVTVAICCLVAFGLYQYFETRRAEANRPGQQ